METKPESGIQIKVFIGIPITSEIKMHLSQSQNTGQFTSLKELKHEKTTYIGMFIDKDHPTLKEIEEIRLQIQQHLETLCPEISLKAFKFTLFPQLFLS